ncbi:ArsR/SmtB family transcription factor [Oceanobacillus sojae]|nr:metalloregulator ArsR/SmtB family transcription factor [Oceanobacillus sojae]
MKTYRINDIFKVLQDETRIKIIEIIQKRKEERMYLPATNLAENSFCPQDILRILNNEEAAISNTKLSYHLKEMRNANILNLEREGKRYFYSVNHDTLNDMIDWVRSIQQN